MTNSEIGEKIATETIKGIQKGVNAPGVLVAKVESSNAQLSLTGILRGTNAERAKLGIALLGNNTKLNRIAEIRMQDMFARGYFEHVSPQGQSASSVAGDVGYPYVTVGENIAMGNFATDAVLVQAWMDSPGHKENILRDVYTEIGIAVAKSEYQGRMTWIAVQIFAKPLSDCPVVDKQIKAQIDAEISTIDQLKITLNQKEAELDRLKEAGEWESFNAEVSTYNSMVKDINARSAELQSTLSLYNSQVRAFNACIQ